ncbi:MAG: hypothetical protein OEZ07_03455 [Dehalococcoidia bacterium]|nr:hypothetical protein [Dehalococcoidia bacterium]
MLLAKVKRLLGIIVILALVIGGSTPFLVNSWPVVAQDGETFQLAPINPKALELASPYGYRPPTMDLSHLRNIPVQEARA